MTSKSRFRQQRGLLPFFVLLLAYLGLLAGDQGTPLLGGDAPALEIRAIILIPLLVGVIALTYSQPSSSSLRAKPFTAWLVIFFVYLVSTSLWSPVGSNPNPTYLDSGYLLTYTGVGIAASARMQPRLWRHFWIFIVLISVVFALGGIVGSGIGQGRMAAFGGGPNVFVRIVGTGALISLYLACRTVHFRWFVPIVLLASTAVFSGSRGGMLALALTFAISAAIGYRWVRERRRGFAFAIAVLATGFGAVTLFGDSIYDVIDTRFGEQLLDQGETAGRDGLYAAGLAIWSQSPIFGSGIGSFALLYGRGFSYTHNILLDALVDGGIVALLLILIPIFIATIRVLESRFDFDASVAYAVAVFYFVASQFSGNYYDSRFVWFFLGVACVTALRSMDSGQSRYRE